MTSHQTQHGDPATTDPFKLARFVQAQEGSFPTALAEVTRGRKQSHWMWFILPQLQGLGSSAMSQKFGISGLDEAVAYLAHPVLGPRLVEVVEAIRQHKGSSPEAVLGSVDARKFQSCLTLFERAAPRNPCFHEVLQQFFGGERDAATLDRLNAGPS